MIGGRSAALACLLALLLAAASAARAQDCGVAPTGTSYSRVRFGAEAYDSGYQTGRPADSSVSHSFMTPDYNVGTEAASTVDADAFGTSASVGGSMAIDPIYTRGASSNASGTWRDCLVIDGQVGQGRLHIPLHLDGTRTLSFATGGAYIPPDGSPPIARAIANLGCTAFTVGAIVPDTCPDFAYDWSDSGELDETVELVAPFTFGAPLDFRIDPTVSVGLGYTPSGAAGVLNGSAAIDLSGTMLAATVTDANGTPLPAATIAAESGFDYFHPVPEPETSAGAAALVALAVLAKRRSPHRSG
jgi:hypothetical protein